MRLYIHRKIIFCGKYLKSTLNPGETACWALKELFYSVVCNLVAFGNVLQQFRIVNDRTLSRMLIVQLRDQWIYSAVCHSPYGMLQHEICLEIYDGVKTKNSGNFSGTKHQATLI